MCRITTWILFYYVTLTASFPAFQVLALILLMVHNTKQDIVAFISACKSSLCWGSTYFNPITSYIIAPTMSSHYVTWHCRDAVKYWNPRASVVCLPWVLLRKCLQIPQQHIQFVVCQTRWITENGTYLFRVYSTQLKKWRGCVCFINPFQRFFSISILYNKVLLNMDV